MIKNLEDHLTHNFPFLKGKKLLLATSGGLDSMVMVDIFNQLNYSIAIAHCNFQLRGVESFDDQKFVQDYADIKGIPIYVTQFDTQAFAEDYKLSTQVAARELRYSWFYELLETEHYDYILTAHHADDNVETFLINLARGTGIQGLTGIPKQNENIIRPLLSYTREQIEKYARKNSLQWREDSSNASDKYLRNKIRHHLIPLLKELNPHFLSSFQKTQSYLQEASDMVDDAAIMVYQQVATQEGDDIYFNLQQLKKLPNYKSYLYQWLNEFGFSAWEDVYDLVNGQSGKQVLSPDFRLVKDRDALILSPINFVNKEETYWITEEEEEVKIPLNLSISKVNDLGMPANTTIFVDADKLEFPLILRRWTEGVSFQPFGMKGKSKKVSKLFKDEKLSMIDKENTWLLYSGEEVVWVVGIRQDERFRINSATKKILKIELD